jgi:hypothetical protein
MRGAGELTSKVGDELRKGQIKLLPGTRVFLPADATDDEIDAFCRALGWTPEGEAEDAKVAITLEVEESETTPSTGT